MESNTTSQATMSDSMNQEHVPSKPKRPLSGYNFFYRDFRRQHGRIVGGLRALTGEVARAWKNLDARSKRHYKALGKRSQDQYRQDMEVWSEWLVQQTEILQNEFDAQKQEPTRRLNSYEIAEHIRHLRSIGVIRQWTPGELPVGSDDGVTDSSTSGSDTADVFFDSSVFSTDARGNDDSSGTLQESPRDSNMAADAGEPDQILVLQDYTEIDAALGPNNFGSADEPSEV